MLIDRIDCTAVSYPLEKEYRHAGFSFKNRQMVLASIYTDDGLVGYGESGCVNAEPLIVKAIMESELVPLLIGQNPLERTRLHGEMTRRTSAHGGPGLVSHAISGLDTALWDICAKSAGLPLWLLLGGCRDKVTAYATGGLWGEDIDPMSVGEEMGAYISKGFRAVKVKVGLDCRDSLRVRLVRDAVGPDVLLMLDANSALSPKDALRFIGSVEDQNIAFFEEPVDPRNSKGLREVRRSSGVPVAGGENMATLPVFGKLLADDAVDILQADVTRCGGIGPMRDVSALALAYNITFMPHSFSSGICLAANLHIASAFGCPYIEVDQTPNVLRDHLVQHDFLPESDGMLKVPEGPGLGVAPDPFVVARYSIG